MMVSLLPLDLVARPLRRAAIAALATMVVASSGAAAVPPSFSSPIRLGFPNGDDWEPAIAADRSGRVYVLWSHYVGFAGTSAGDVDPSCPECPSPHSVLQVSTDRGASFGAPRALSPDIVERQDDPQILVDPADGRTVYAGFMVGNKSSQYVARSDDLGATWRPVLTEQLQRGTDKDILAARGNDVYLLYHTQQKVYVSISHDRGATWSLQNPLGGTTNVRYGVSFASGGAVAPDGTVYFALNGVRRPGQVKGTINLYVIRSTDRGETWEVSQVGTSRVPPDCGCEGYGYWSGQIALAADAAGTVYILWNANASDRDPNELSFARSTDRGQTWSAAVDPSGAPSGTNHLFPAITAGAGGDVRIAWQDDRNGHDAGGHDPNARWNTYYRASSDGGATWTDEAQLSAYAASYGYKFAGGYLQPYGDYFEIDIDDRGKTVAIWGEGYSFTGPGNVWFARAL